MSETKQKHGGNDSEEVCAADECQNQVNPESNVFPELCPDCTLHKAELERKKNRLVTDPDAISVHAVHCPNEDCEKFGPARPGIRVREEGDPPLNDDHIPGCPYCGTELYAIQIAHREEYVL